jgi:hypothetical protein
MEALKQPQYAALSIEKQILVIYARYILRTIKPDLHILFSIIMIVQSSININLHLCIDLIFSYSWPVTNDDQS